MPKTWKFTIKGHEWCRTRHHGDLKNISVKRTNLWYLVFWWRMVLFKESSPSIMVTRNPNWSTKILWYETVYVKGKILSLLKRPARDTLHCWFCFKLLEVCWFMLWWFDCNIPNSSVNEYSTIYTSNT
jgi:hypothetical protein